MASQNKIIELIGAIKTIYSYYAKDSDIEMLVKTWSALLKAYPDEAVDAALYKCLQKCKVPPTPADIIENINALAKLNEPTDEELWAVYNDALNKVLRLIPMFAYTYVDETGLSQGDQARQKVTDIWNGLPEKIKMYLADRSELIRRARELDYTDASYERTRFLKTMPIMEARRENSNFLLTIAENRLMLE